MDFYIGTLMPFPYNFVPKTFMACNGQILPISAHTALYSLLGNNYGGEQVGAQQVTLVAAELPQHTHGFGLPAAADPSGASQSPIAGGAMIDPGAAGIFVSNGTLPQTTLSPLAVAPAGNSLPHENMQPWMELLWCICHYGLYPPRG